MVRFLTTDGCSQQIEKIIDMANDKIVLMCPFFKVRERVMKRLIRKANENVKITVVMKDIWNQPYKQEREIQRLKTIPNITIKKASRQAVLQ